MIEVLVTCACKARPNSSPKMLTEGATSAYTAERRDVSRLLTPLPILGKSQTTMKDSTKLTPTCNRVCEWVLLAQVI